MVERRGAGDEVVSQGLPDQDQLWMIEPVDENPPWAVPLADRLRQHFLFYTCQQGQDAGKFMRMKFNHSVLNCVYC